MEYKNVSAKYHVGQMVQIIESPYIPVGMRKLIGVTTTISAAMYRASVINGLEGWWYLLKLKASPEFSYRAHQDLLRPIYDGDLPSSWATFEKICGFNPAIEIVNG